MLTQIWEFHDTIGKWAQLDLSQIYPDKLNECKSQTQTYTLHKPRVSLTK